LAANRIPSPFAVALHEPEIPQNAGNIARLCAATGTPLHLVGRLGFSLRGPQARRAGMDYWDRVVLRRHATFDDLVVSRPSPRVMAFTTRGTMSLWDVRFAPDDLLLFGSESAGLPHSVLRHDAVETVRIPMSGGERSLNLSSAVAVGLYEALRQLDPPR